MKGEDMRERHKELPEAERAFVAKPQPVVTLKPISAQVRIIISIEKDGESSDLHPVEVTISAVQMNGISLGQIRDRAIQRLAEELKLKEGG